MACNDFQYTPAGRQGIGLNQPQSGLDYPLVQPSADIKYLLADFYLAYDGADNIRHPLRIAGLYGFGCSPAPQPFWAPAYAHAADIRIVDSGGRVVFDSAALSAAFPVISFDTWCWGLKKTANCPATHDYRVYEWISERVVCRAVVYQTWPPSSNDFDEDARRDYQNNFEPENAVIDERAVYRMPKRVLSLRSKNSVTVLKQTDVKFVAGFNTAIAVSEQQIRGVRALKQLTFDAVPGAGLGKYSNCEEKPTVYYKINGATGPDISLSPHACLWAKIPTVFSTVAGQGVVTPQLIDAAVGHQIGSNCPACCTCQDYVDTALYMNSIRDRYKQIGVSAHSALLGYEENIDRWLAQRDCRLRDPIKVCMTAQRCPYIDVIVQYCNNCTDCAKNVVLNINFTTDNGNSADTVCGYTSSSVSGFFALGGGYPNFTASLGDVDAGNSASIKFRLEFGNAEPTTVTATASGTTESGDVNKGCEATAEKAAAIVTKALYCDDTGNTVALCN